MAQHSTLLYTMHLKTARGDDMRGLQIRLQLIAGMAAALVLLAPAGMARAVSGPSATVREAQTIMKKFTIPGGPVDGYSGPLTQRGLCVTRHMLGLTPSRANLDKDLLRRMRTLNTTYSGLNDIPAPNLDGNATYLLVLQKCQVMAYATDGHYERLIPVTTGTDKPHSTDGRDHQTPTGAHYLGYTEVVRNSAGKVLHPKGWSCSTIYPEGCAHHVGMGENSKYSDYGNMYNKRLVVGDVFVHGSTDIRTAPASHGCIRVSISDSDWMFHNVGNDSKPYIKVVGSYYN